MTKIGSLRGLDTRRKIGGDKKKKRKCTALLDRKRARAKAVPILKLLPRWGRNCDLEAEAGVILLIVFWGIGLGMALTPYIWERRGSSGGNWSGIIYSGGRRSSD